MRFLIAALLLSAAPSQEDYFPPPDSQRGWRTLGDAAEIRQCAGMDLHKLDQAWEQTQRCTQHAGLVVIRRGYLVYEKYAGRACRGANPDMASCGKAFTSIACGIMLEEKKDAIPDGLDTKVFTEKYLPEAFPLDDPRRAEITLGQLLSMTAGYHEEGKSPGIRNGEVVPLTPVPGTGHPRSRSFVPPHGPLVQTGRGLLLLLARAAHRLAGLASRNRHGAPGEHWREAGQADGMGRVGLLSSSRRLHDAPCERRREHREVASMKT